MHLVIICSLLGGFISLLGGIFLLNHKKYHLVADYLTALAGGSLLAAAFSDLLPEALHGAENANFAIWSTLFGLLFFFILEIILAKFCASHDCEHDHHYHLLKTDPMVPMIVIGDLIHNFMDGIAIAAGFLVSPISGLIVTIAVATHEIPQELGEFALLSKKGVQKNKILFINVISSLATTIAAVIFYYLGDTAQISLTPFLGLVAGFFIYLAVSDIIPSINHEKDYRLKVLKAGILIASVIITSFLIVSLHSWAEFYLE